MQSCQYVYMQTCLFRKSNFCSSRINCEKKKNHKKLDLSEISHCTVDQYPLQWYFAYPTLGAISCVKKSCSSTQLYVADLSMLLFLNLKVVYSVSSKRKEQIRREQM